MAPREEISLAAARTVTRGGHPIRLTQREFTLLEALALNQGRVVSRAAIQSEAAVDYGQRAPWTVVYNAYTQKRKPVNTKAPTKVACRGRRGPIAA